MVFAVEQHMRTVWPVTSTERKWEEKTTRVQISDVYLAQGTIKILQLEKAVQSAKSCKLTIKDIVFHSSCGPVMCFNLVFITYKH